ALNYLGYTYAEMGVRLDEAEKLIRRALEIEPDDGFYVDSLGWVYYQRGDYRRAVEHLERAVELAGDDPTVAEHLGDAYSRAGHPGPSPVRGPAGPRPFSSAPCRSRAACRACGGRARCRPPRRPVSSRSCPCAAPRCSHSGRAPACGRGSRACGSARRSSYAG